MEEVTSELSPQKKKLVRQKAGTKTFQAAWIIKARNRGAWVPQGVNTSL